MRRLLCVVSVLFVSLANPEAQESLPADDYVRDILAKRVDAQGDGVAIIVGLIEPGGARRVVSYGAFEPEQRQLDGDTLFEIGSLTKVFTALLLAEMVDRGQLALTDPLAIYVDADTKVPQRNGRQITLFDLATHTAGLPMMPGNFPSFADSAATRYSSAELNSFLSGYTLPRDIGAERQYSNAGYSLLGYALARRAGSDYERVVQERVIAPLELTSTVFTVTPSLRERFAIGHDASSQPAAPFAFPVFAPAGGLVSSANDLLRFLAVALGHEESPMARALAATLDATWPMATRRAQALGWVVDDELISHDGGTLGYASSLAWDRNQRAGVVVLSNSVVSVGDIARHLLRRDLPLDAPTTTHRTEIPLDPALAACYVGRYDSPGGSFVVAREGDSLTIGLPETWGLPTLRLRAETERDFFTVELPIRATFGGQTDGCTQELSILPPRATTPIQARKAGR
jgi:D-alanyl-D-alanine-carboxypeptidase/D-alanyl-D-alanine-endopeptidase